MKWPLAERFKAPQGEGLYAGTPMAFLRFVGCSVGQKVCTACDTQFDRMDKEKDGGVYETADLVEWVRPYRHACLTGGEPLDRNLTELILALNAADIQTHIESSGTVRPDWFDHENHLKVPGRHYIGSTYANVWLTISPKPGYLAEMLRYAEEIKVIIGGLGDGPGWPTIDDAAKWAREGRLVYVQPRNHINTVNMEAMAGVVNAITDVYPELRLSTQLHKYIRTR